MNTMKTVLGKGQLWAGIILFAMLTWMLPQTAVAETFVDKTINYSVTMSGSNKIRIQVPVYDEDGADCFVCDGKLKISVDGESGETVLFRWFNDESSHDNDESDLWCKFQTWAGGDIEVTQGNSANHFTIEKSSGEMRRLVYESNDGKTYTIYAVWRLPYELLGKKIKFMWDVERDGTSRSKMKVQGLNDTEITIPAAEGIVTPQVTTGSLSYSEKGKLEVPWYIGTNKIDGVWCKYEDKNGVEQTETLKADRNDGMIYLDATVPHKRFHVIVDYKDNNNYPIKGVSSDPDDMPVVHAPVGLTATPLGDSKAKVKLKWSIEYPGSEDLTTADYFEVQRSLTGLEADFVSIGAVPFVLSPKEQTFTYVDSTLINAVSEDMLKGNGTLENVTYRIRRAITQTWEWEGNPAATSTSCVVDDIHLLRIKNYSAQWEDERAHTVRVAWEYANEYNAVWDERAEMKMRVISYNRKGEEVENNEYVMTQDERKNRYKILALTRPCVDYKIEMYVNRANSPLHLWNEIESYFFPIKNASDWQIFRNKVNNANGQYEVNARLYADITTSLNIGYDSDKPYKGIFDGNGHTVNFSLTGYAEHIAMFRYVSDATIKNLNVKGTVNSDHKFNSGLIAKVQENGNVKIENCRSSVTLKNTILGDATMGGFVGIVGNGATLKISNSLFDGSLEGEDCYMNGGFVGWTYGNVTIESCLFAPKHLGTRRTGCETFARNTSWVTVKNSFATQEYNNTYIINSTEDWLLFSQAVRSAAGTYDVDAILNADISTDVGVGYQNTSPYRGTFNGNGHTLNVNIDGSEYYTAPFSMVKDCTIKNLHVTGRVKGSNYTSGLIGSHPNASGGTVRIDNVQVSTIVTCTSTHCGGFIGHGRSYTHLINNCKFDGSVLAGFVIDYAGAIIGWEDGGTANAVTNCLDNGYYSTKVQHAGMNYAMGTAYGNVNKNTNNWSYNNWGEVNKAQYSMSVDEMIQNLGADNWTKGSSLIPVPKMFTDPIGILNVEDLLIAFGSDDWESEGQIVVPKHTQYVPIVASYPTPELPTFHHESNGKLEKKLITDSRQSSVLLSWNTDGNPIDYFTVLRRVKGTTVWDIVKSNIDQTSYEDMSVLPLVDYEYQVCATNDCEGLTSTYTEIKEGACKHTGKLEGYVRFNDGTGVAGINVDITSEDGKDTRLVTTDDSGYFMAEDLTYQGNTSVTYNVTPVSTGDRAIQMENGTRGVTFDDQYNYRQLPEFTVTNGLQFNAYVMYDGTSIPVKGVRFKVNGYEMHNSNDGVVETDFEGHVKFNVLSGNNIIQAVMDGHKFKNDGYYKGEEGFNMKDKVGQAYFYDATLVKLTGRVVGGKDQGDLPLDNNLSRNNLGQNLTMVMGLEGDNTSWLVFDNQNPEKKQREEVFQHPAGGGHATHVDVQRKRMTVKPDSVTGEYVLMLPPVRWKVMQVYCEGYPTLFQDGMVSEVIDLTQSLKPDTMKYEKIYYDVDKRRVVNPQEIYNARYNRIYHAPVEITYEQVGYDSIAYFGDRFYQCMTADGTKVDVPLVYPDSLGKDYPVHYTFGAPVFSLERRYPIKIAVVERYPWNGSTRSTKIDKVKIGGGKVTVHNGMKNGMHQEVVKLDSLGEGIFYLSVDQTTRLLTNKDAKKTVTMTLEQNGTTYEATPLSGYVLNMFPISGSKDVLSTSTPMLIDILRDPPGAGSTATLSKGSKLKMTYSMDAKFEGGISFSWAKGSSLDNYSGVVSVGAEFGIINGAKVDTKLALDYIVNFTGKKAYSYTMSVNEDITTSSAATMVGADADLYIGTVQNIVVTPMSTIRAIPDRLYKQMQGRLSGSTLPTSNTLKYGSLVHIAEGRDSKDSLFHLVRDESIGYGPKVTSQFVHAQRYIVSELIPALTNEIRALMFTGTEEEAQNIADKTNQPVYWSKVPASDPNFCVDYVMKTPEGSTTNYTDEVNVKHQNIMAWVNMIATNEREKLFATDLVANLDVDGGTKMTHSETFESEFSESSQLYIPFVTNTDYFSESNTASFLSSVASTIVSQPIVKALVDAALKKLGTNKSVTYSDASEGGKQGGMEIEVKFGGAQNKFTIVPVLKFDSKGTETENKVYNRKESFNIAMDAKSHLNVDVYRVRTMTSDVSKAKDYKFSDVFYNTQYDAVAQSVMSELGDNMDTTKVTYPRSFVYRTRGGATCNSWEDARYTQAFKPGTLLDERTKKICNPKLSFDRQSVSGVAVGTPARFKVYLTNDSEQPEAATGGLTGFTFYLDESSNPNGAKVFVDGSPLNGNGLTVILNPGKVVEKTIEIYAGAEFDYEGLTFGVASSSDWRNTACTSMLDVHFLREAGPVNISSPGDKWVMNTDAQYNKERGWFLPITIDGFNKYQHNFDHIEFQYKESQRGEEYWTNLCSYYADSTLMAQANGVCAMIPQNGNIHTEFYGEGTVIEKAYDLRAVLYCRNGNSFLTTSSKVMSGVKDTRRPQLFGTPEPRDGILKLGDNIIFNFSEDIEYNYLNNITNFEVKGEVNNNQVSESVSIQFDGSSSVETEALRNFSGKDLTIDLMIKPDKTNKDMPLFSHGTNGKTLQMWLTSDYKLKAVVNKQEFTTTKAINPAGFRQVAMVINDSILRLYDGGTQLDSFKLKELYTGTGPLIFGRTNETNRKNSQFYKGHMMEARLWYRALSGGQIGSTYGQKRLTGYELGLVDYYPMNEGSGKYALDKTQGANAELKNAFWAMPKGLSLHLDWEDQGLALSEDALNRSNEQDYTLMFWFKTDPDGRGVLLSNGAGRKDENNAQNQFCLGFEAEKLMYRTHGMAVEVSGDWSDNQWHHYAMTVNRSRGLANIYVDQSLRATFSADSLGGISGGHPMIGAARYSEMQANGQMATVDTHNWLRGNVDELCLFSQALPPTLIKTFSTKSPNGDEAGLLTYLSFERQERLEDNDLELVAYPYSKRIYLDDKGNIRYELDSLTKQPTNIQMRDYLFLDDVETVKNHIDATQAAPVVPYEELKNLTFSCVGKDNQIMVGIDELNSRINRRNIYVTVRDIEDKNGNAMASPATACYYVTSSALQWMSNREKTTVRYGEGDWIYLYVVNNSSQSHTFTIENCPKWLTLDNYTNVIGPQDLVSIKATVNKGLNIGTYDEIIHLVDEDGVSEPLYLNLTVEGETPAWAWNINSDLLQHSMNIVGQVVVNDEIDIDSRDIVGVFGRDNECHGFAHIDYSAQTGESNLYLTAYDNVLNGRELNFRLWQYATGRELQLKVSVDGGALSDTIHFRNAAVLGTDKPVRLVGGEYYVQTFDLKEGWNWISFNVASEALFNLNKLLDEMPWVEGDVLTDMNSDMTLVYRGGHWLASGSISNVVITPKKAFAIKVQHDTQFPIPGNIIKQEDERTIRLKQGWNGIGYTPMLNLSVETALSDYYSKAQPGDVIKSHSEFAYFTVSGGAGRWKGNLQYMKPGEGYMFLRKDATEAKFRYPFYEPSSTFIDEWAYTASKAPKRHSTRNTMSVSAMVNGVELEEGDKLIAFMDGEIVGETLANSTEETCYLSIDGDSKKGIWFAIEREGEMIAATNEVMTFSANAVVGSPDEPTVINFVRHDNENGKWYTTSGIQLSKRPKTQGVYIFNGKKIVIK